MGSKIGISYPSVGDQLGASNVPSNILKNVTYKKTPEYGSISTFEKVGRTGSSFLNTALAFTGAGSLALLGGQLFSSSVVPLADMLNDGGTSKALKNLANKTNNPVSPAETVPLPDDVLNPYSPSKFTFDEDNSPALLAGTMQSAEIVALALGSLVQITADNHAEHMAVLASDIGLRFDHGERIASSLESITPILLAVAETLNLPDLQNAVLANGNAIASAVVDRPQANVQAINNVDVSPIVEQMKKSDNAFRQTYIPTSEFWGRADSATIKYNRYVGTTAPFDVLPSVDGVISEVNMIADMVDRGASQSEIIKAIETSRKNSLGTSVYALTMYSDDPFNSQDELNKSMKTYYDNALNTKVPEATVAMSQSLADIAKWSEKAKSREEYLQTPIDFKDSDGDVIASASPMEITANKDAQHYKNLDDKNTVKYDEDDFNAPFDAVALVPFIGREDVFNTKKEVPSTNVFIDKIKSLFPNFF